MLPTCVSSDILHFLICLLLWSMIRSLSFLQLTETYGSLKVFHIIICFIKFKLKSKDRTFRCMQSFLPPEAHVQDMGKGRGQEGSQLHFTAVWIQTLLGSSSGVISCSHLSFVNFLFVAGCFHPFVSLAQHCPWRTESRCNLKPCVHLVLTKPYPLM